MLFHIGQLFLREHIGGHILVLDPIVSKQGRRLGSMQIHGLEALKIQGGNGVVALPQGPAPVIIQALYICL